MPGPVVAAARRGARRARDTALHAAGGPARLRVVLTLAAVLGLSGADTGTISSTTGILADRTRRTRLLGGAIVVWAAATALSGAATSYRWLLLARVGLGAATAAAGPTLASLTGDYFPASDRGRMYGLILGGDLVGSGPRSGLGWPGLGRGAAWRVMTSIRSASARRCCGSTRWSRTASGAGLSARTVT